MHCLPSLSGEGTVTLSICDTLCVCVCVHRAVTARRISLGGEGNALYLLLSRLSFVARCKLCGFQQLLVLCVSEHITEHK